METSTVRLYSLNYSQTKTYIFAAAFVIGNIALPQACHLVNLGGPMWLPIYFFTLIAAYKYGLKVGLLTAALSPIINSVLFGMPAAQMLPIILVKSGLLAIAASFAANYFKKVSFLGIISAVIAYQLIGTIIEYFIVGGWYTALQDIRIGIPGILTQIIGGYFVLRYLLKN